MNQAALTTPAGTSRRPTAVRVSRQRLPPDGPASDEHVLSEYNTTARPPNGTRIPVYLVPIARPAYTPARINQRGLAWRRHSLSASSIASANTINNRSP